MPGFVGPGFALEEQGVEGELIVAAGGESFSTIRG
jgi:hypothetical protein